MKSDRRKWNRKHLQYPHPKPPATVLTRFIDQAHPGRALDLACGTGGNSLFLAERGFRVDAIDISKVALSAFSHTAITKIEVDLDDYSLPSGTYQIIVNTFFLDRRLFTGFQRGLAPGGLLIFQTHMQGSHRISNPNYKLKSAELRSAFAGLEMRHYEESDGLATLIARRNPQPATASGYGP